MQIFNYELKFGPNERLINLTTLKIKMVFTWQKKKTSPKTIGKHCYQSQKATDREKNCKQGADIPNI